MTGQKIHFDHLAIAAPSKVLEDVVTFYDQVLDLKPGPMIEVEGIKGYWLYSGGSALLHLIEDESRTDQGKNSFDHVAFRCSDLEAMQERLQGHSIDFVFYEEESEKQALLFISDPAGTAVELNFYLG